jgi:hypothetical protein
MTPDKIHFCSGDLRYLFIPEQLKMHYNNRGLFCDPNIIANNKERNF